MVFLGKLVGAILFEPVIERVGCKKTLYIGASIQILGIIRTSFLSILPIWHNDTVELSAKEWIQFTTGRVLTYLAVGLVDTTVPTYEAELAPAALRGFFAGNVQVFVHIGAIWGSSMSRAFATETGRVGWMVPVGVQMIVCPPCFGISTNDIARDHATHAGTILYRIATMAYLPRTKGKNTHYGSSLMW